MYNAESIIKSRKKGNSRKLEEISAAVRLSKEAHLKFGTELLTMDKLKTMNPDEISNVHTELRIQLGYPRGRTQWQKT